MLVTFDDLPHYRGRVSLVDGAFDPLHAGHLAYFDAALALGAPLLCRVAADDYVRTKHPPLLPHWQRVLVVDALRSIAVTYQDTHAVETVLEQLRPRAYVKGRDWAGRLPPRQVELCGRLGIQIVFVETLQESSTRLLESCLARMAPPAPVIGRPGS